MRPGYTQHHSWGALPPCALRKTLGVWWLWLYGKMHEENSAEKIKGREGQAFTWSREQLPRAMDFTGRRMEGLKINILEKKSYKAFRCTRKEKRSNRNISVRKWKDMYNATSTDGTFSLIRSPNASKRGCSTGGCNKIRATLLKGNSNGKNAVPVLQHTIKCGKHWRKKSHKCNVY